MKRQALPPGTPVKMPNGAAYVIDRLIGEGGFSLIYAACGAGDTAPVAIKEFYPWEGCQRDSCGKVRPLEGEEGAFAAKLARFEREAAVGGLLSQHSFQTVALRSCGDGFAVMGLESGDMVSLAGLEQAWRREEPLPETGDPRDCDPVFPRLVRLRYALGVADSVLAALSAVHRQGYLHLDLSARNVLWAGQDMATGRGCAAFLADFGCAAPLEGGLCRLEGRPSFSRGFSAPEALREGCALTPATDLYAVGALLFYLCAGEGALEITRSRVRQIERETARMGLPQGILSRLQRLLCRALDSRMEARFQTAGEFQGQVRSLRDAIPLRPVNRDPTRDFTLCSLRDMLQGGGRWAQELLDRRGGEAFPLPQAVGEPVTWRPLGDGAAFLEAALPEELWGWLREKCREPGQPGLEGILSGRYDGAWKGELCQKVRRYGTRRLLQASRSLLDDEGVFGADLTALFRLLGEDGERLRACCSACNGHRSPYIALGMLTLYALLGPEGFCQLLPSPSMAGKLFAPL